MDKPATTFKPGDRVRVVNQESPFHGAITTVVSELRLVRCQLVNGASRLAWVHGVDLKPTAPGWNGVGFSPDELRHVYDGHEPTSWDNCVWRPDKVTA